MRRAVLDLASPRPLWRMPAEAATRVRRAFGRGWEVRVIRAPASSDGDGGAGSPAAVRAARGAEVYFGWGLAPDVARAGWGTLRWVHSASAGVGASLSPEFRTGGAILTNSRGVYAEPMADWVITAIGFCLRGFFDAVSAQRERRWIKDEFTDGRVRVRELRGARVGIVGLGGIGAAVATRCAALGMEVSGIRRRPRRPRPRGVTWVGGPRQLKALARRSDVLVIAAPGTAETTGIVDAAVLAALPRGSFVVNLSRGALLDEAALQRHLERGRLGGCVLDVFMREPLPARHPLWRHPRVLVSPHVSGVSERFWTRESALMIENIRRYRSGRRLLNQVDPDAGY